MFPRRLCEWPEGGRPTRDRARHPFEWFPELQKLVFDVSPSSGQKEHHILFSGH
ncbi:hypothetical protein FQA47_004062, partial [Oryzias melastigma]